MLEWKDWFFDQERSIHMSKRRTREEVSSYYNSLRDTKSYRKKRKQSPIAELRRLNNWVKAVLIQNYTPQHATVLDICGGKGGDLRKFHDIESYVLVDNAERSVDDAKIRFINSKFKFAAQFIHADCHQPDILKSLIPADIEFDLVSCQFALHYSFESEESARGLLSNISNNLKKGSHFIGTVVDGDYVMKNMRETSEFGNTLFRCQGEGDWSDMKADAFGIKYNFTLKGAVENVPEFIVHFPMFEKIALGYGLKLVYKSNFHTFYAEHVVSHAGLLKKMGIDVGQVFCPDQWKVALLYTAFAFVKI